MFLGKKSYIVEKPVYIQLNGAMCKKKKNALVGWVAELSM